MQVALPVKQHPMLEGILTISSNIPAIMALKFNTMLLSGRPPIFTPGLQNVLRKISTSNVKSATYGKIAGCISVYFSVIVRGSGVRKAKPEPNPPERNKFIHMINTGQAHQIKYLSSLAVYTG
ncbi:hypothetical protein SAMN04487787_105218 [Kosakonia sacchari]|nr:hypothetical protein SAMN04487787_105218 [Kosakonia sacchari]